MDPFWQEVHETCTRIVAEAAQNELQDRTPEFFYITSQVLRGRNRIANRRVCLAQRKLAAQRICENTHLLSTRDEISTYLEDQKKKKQDIESAEALRRGSISFNGAPPVPTASKGE